MGCVHGHVLGLDVDVLEVDGRADGVAELQQVLHSVTVPHRFTTLCGFHKVETIAS